MFHFSQLSPVFAPCSHQPAGPPFPSPCPFPHFPQPPPKSPSPNSPKPNALQNRITTCESKENFSTFKRKISPTFEFFSKEIFCRRLIFPFLEILQDNDRRFAFS